MFRRLGKLLFWLGIVAAIGWVWFGVDQWEILRDQAATVAANYGVVSPGCPDPDAAAVHAEVAQDMMARGVSPAAVLGRHSVPDELLDMLTQAARGCSVSFMVPKAVPSFWSSFAPGIFGGALALVLLGLAARYILAGAHFALTTWVEDWANTLGRLIRGGPSA